MARNRVIYQSQAVYCSQTAYNEPQIASGAIEPLQRVQSANYSFSVARQDVNQFGELAAIDRIIIDTPTVSFDTSYYVANLCNEKLLGFRVAPSGSSATTMTSCISDIIDSSTAANQKNYYVLTTAEGSDATDLRATGKYESIIGIGNGFITSYNTEAAVGGLPTASISIEGQNMNFVNMPYLDSGVNNTDAGLGFRFGTVNGVSNQLTYISGESPAVNAEDGVMVRDIVAADGGGNQSGYAALPVYSGNSTLTGAGTISSLRPGDITLTLVEHTEGSTLNDALMNTAATADDVLLGADIKDAHIQSYNISFDLSRTPIDRLGSRFAFARVVDFPITASLSVDAVLADLTSGNIAEYINCDKSYDAIIKMRGANNCVSDLANKPIVAAICMRKIKLDSESFTSSIGDNKSVTLDFSNQIGGPEQTDVGIFMSGYSVVNQQRGY